MASEVDNPLLVYWMCVRAVMPLKDNSFWMLGVPKGLFTATLYYVVPAALSQDVLSVLGSPRLPSKHRLFDTGQKDSSPCLALPLLVTVVKLALFSW